MTKKNVPVLIITFCLLFLAAWLPRMAGLDQLVTVDEPKWLTRSANFYQAIANGQANDTYQSEHPGVTIMWAGTLGFLQQYPAYAKDVPGQFTWETPELERWLAAENGPTPLDLLQAARWWIVFAISAVIALGVFPLRTLFGLWPAILITLFVAWDPFYIALSRQLHPDGLLTSFIYLSLLLFLAWLYGDPQRLRSIILSGVAMGLAWLTKTPAILLTVAIGLLAAFELLRKGWGRKRFVLEMTAWISVAAVTCLLLWPVLVDGSAQRLGPDSRGHARLHQRPRKSDFLSWGRSHTIQARCFTLSPWPFARRRSPSSGCYSRRCWRYASSGRSPISERAGPQPVCSSLQSSMAWA